MALPTLDQMPEFHRRLMAYLGEPKAAEPLVPPLSQNWFTDRLGLTKRASEVVWFGMDLATKPDVSVECTWHEDGVEIVKVGSSKPRHEPFPNPEPMQYRPKV